MSSGISCQSAYIDEILQRKSASWKSKSALTWALVNFCIVLLLIADLNQGLSVIYTEDFLSLIWYTELSLALLFAINTMYHLWTYFSPAVAQTPLDITPKQKKLFGLEDNDKGFNVVTAKSSPSSSDTVSPSNHSFLVSSLQSSPSSHPSLMSIPSLDFSSASWASTSLTSSPNMSLSSSSWIFYPQGSPLNQSSGSQNSPYLTDGQNRIVMRKRVCTSPSRTSPTNCNISLEGSIKSDHQLEKYLKEHEEQEQLMQLMTSENHAGTSKLWNYQRMAANYVPLLRKYQYQPAVRSSQSVTSHNDDSPTTHSGDGILNKLKITESQLNTWIENLRKWISQTVLVRLVSEINSINETLRRLGSADLQIGEVSQSTLRQIALTKGQHLPTLSALLPYLEVTLNQEYLVHRLKDLSKGGCMSEFRWNGGGNYKGKNWEDDLPTDCAIVMHMVCSYMDSRLPPDPHYPDGKTFTSQYFKKTPDKPVLSKDNLCIYQSRISQPHYRVIIGEDSWDLPKGHNNMFCSILLFLHHIKTKQRGMLGRINLGLSGVNILWVLENN